MDTSAHANAAHVYGRHRAALEAVVEHYPLAGWVPIVCDVLCLTPEDIAACPTRVLYALAAHAELVTQTVDTTPTSGRRDVRIAFSS